ncbi:OmpA family protein [Flavobacterium sp. NRK F10]|uniref:OmpA family protein n=1 Tax=Flavobacterium sp. NRK F10 TaxID=2954931 RepID=UPI002090E230|nr:OmpA family protein [Flavobacterium sp. NRK F10]MCO6173857.1 OmpA family protein [Flavobacterium sp. NRK F10]
MKKTILIALSAVLLVQCNAVKNSNNTQRGAVIGAAGGAVIGGILGNNLGKGGKGATGAILGGVIGGVAGGLIGRKMDKQAREIQEQLPGAQVERVGEGIKLTLNENAIRFNLNESSLTSTAKANLDKLVPVFKDYNDTNIIIYGHTDSSGNDDYNMTLSVKRAESVKNYLIAKGLSGSRFEIVGMGETEPIDTNETKEGMANNRRVEFAIIANENMVQQAQQEAQN